MNNTSEKAVQYRNEARDFIEDHFEELSEYRDKNEFPHDLYKKICHLGGNQIIPEEYGGLGNGGIVRYHVLEGLGPYHQLVHGNSYHIARIILELGNERQKGELLPKLANGEIMGAVAVTEPEAGSSFEKMKTTAEREGDTFKINGKKSQLHEGAEADIILVWATVDDQLTTFIVHQDNPGYTPTKQYGIVGGREIPTWDAELDDCVVPDDQVLGEIGDGFEAFTTAWDESRVGNASGLIGTGEYALDRALHYASQREIGDKGYVTDFQGNRWRIADAYARLESAKALRDRAVTKVIDDDLTPLVSATTKLEAAKAGKEATDTAMAITGGHGIYTNTPFFEYIGDVWMFQTGGGTRAVMRNTIADRFLESYEESREKDQTDDQTPGQS
ncbi:acyl-CoA dehydrogenase family protein [Natrinema halophilum]|uniref:acyl-CoA dehydrogenase family protein n=1 Tax=Natrinema halophilum TaxID=1699371 RepID=UPI001F1A8DE7|nr:acyl-CoA dehydrogenase family protein [Natrinema halophilum]UHQ96113.1 acyl-CoA/acyl-ACP dehydrogenase [Natrinema halophilum]